MRKLFIADLLLILATFVGGVYLANASQYQNLSLLYIFMFYVLSKIIGYAILPYSQFQKFIHDLTKSSTVNKISGYEIFKSALVFLLFVGSLFIDPKIWIIESVLVILMRVWARMYVRNLNEL